MAYITLRQAAQWCGGRVDEKYADVVFLGANNDSRKLQPGQLFVALKAERDGHDFIPMAMQRGAAAVLCTHCCGDYPAIVVEDTRRALGDIARAERNRLNMKVVGVTGSVGKSTTKEMIAAVLGSTYRVKKTPVNQNNDIGMPMAILSMPEDTEVAVLEMGMNHFREIAYLSSIAKPDVAVIVNIGTMHIEHLGSREGILKAKMEILEGMQPTGKLILNGDDALLWSQKDATMISPVYFGYTNQQVQIRGTLTQEAEDGLQFLVSAGNACFPIKLALEGRHFVCDALAAVGVGLAMDVALDRIQTSLSQFQNMEGRQEVFSAKGCTIIKDCYNAGPESMEAALTVLGKKSGRRVAVLGDMLELGTCAAEAHYRIGYIVAQNADVLLTYGPHSPQMAEGAMAGGMEHSFVQSFLDKDTMIDILKQTAKPGDTILFKGSRGMHMEWVLEGFLKSETD